MTKIEEGVFHFPNTKEGQAEAAKRTNEALNSDMPFAAGIHGDEIVVAIGDVEIPSSSAFPELPKEE